MTGGDTVTNAAASEPILELRGLRKTFPGVVALDGVDFDCGPARFTRSLAPTVLARARSSRSPWPVFTTPTKAGSGGRGRRPGRLRDSQTARALGVSVIYQDFALAQKLSVAENLFLGRRGSSLIV